MAIGFKAPPEPRQIGEVGPGELVLAPYRDGALLLFTAAAGRARRFLVLSAANVDVTDPLPLLVVADAFNLKDAYGLDNVQVQIAGVTAAPQLPIPENGASHGDLLVSGGEAFFYLKDGRSGAMAVSASTGELIQAPAPRRLYRSWEIIQRTGPEIGDFNVLARSPRFISVP